MANLINLFEESVKNNKDSSLGSRAEFDVQYPTGFLNLDYINGQIIHVNGNGMDFDYDSIGIVDGSINMVIGRSGCGKSTFIKQAAANIIRPFEHGTIFEDSIEGGITAKRNETLTGFTSDTLDDRYFYRNSDISIETFYKSIKIIYDNKMKYADEFRYNTGLYDTRGNKIYKFEPTVYILDSIAMIMPQKLTQEEELSGQMSTTAAAKLLASTMRRIVPLCKAANIIVFMVNHITQNVNINPYQHTKAANIYLKPDETCPGGVTPFYISNNIFRLDDNTKLTEDKDLGIAGNHVLITLIKSRTNRAGASTDMIFNQDIGFDPILSLFVMLKEFGKIKGAGAFYYIEGLETCKFAQKNFKSKLLDNKELYDCFIAKCIEVLRSNLVKQNEVINSSFNSSCDLINDMITSIESAPTTV